MGLIVRKFFLKFAFSVFFLFLGLFLIFSSVMGWANYQGKWEDKYSNSNTSDAGCLICHSQNRERLNAYGREICLSDGVDLVAKLIAVESLDSDGDGTTNLSEIQFNTQPGWTEGDNPLYYSDTCAYATTNIPVPDAVPQPYDPAINCVIFFPFVVNSDG